MALADVAWAPARMTGTTSRVEGREVLVERTNRAPAVEAIRSANDDLGYPPSLKDELLSSPILSH